MASVAMACRTSARCIGRQLGGSVTARGFRSSASRLAAHNFVMPAMSPTMTEGNIASWKVKEGDSFSAGDVLLEIETDKAQMDVEAQENGVMAKITQGDGTKSIKVGTRIAVLADEGDDVDSLQIPPEDQNAPQGAKEESSKSPSHEKPPKETAPKQPAKSQPNGAAPEGTVTRKQKYPLYPAVQHLLHENGLPLEEADKIPASGPNGRLLKGDVLAHLGRIDRSHAANLAKRLEKLSHLDLSNIKIAAPPEPKPAPAKEMTVSEEDLLQSISLSVSLKAVLDVQQRLEKSTGVHLPVSTFVLRATELANEDLPRGQAPKVNKDDLFNSLVGVPVSKTSRGSYVPQFAYFGEGPAPIVPAPSAKLESDPFDTLIGRRSASRRAPTFTTMPAVVSEVYPATFSLEVGKGEEKRAKVFLERLKLALQTEPGRLVL